MDSIRKITDSILKLTNLYQAMKVLISTNILSVNRL